VADDAELPSTDEADEAEQADLLHRLLAIGLPEARARQVIEEGDRQSVLGGLARAEADDARRGWFAYARQGTRVAEQMSPDAEPKPEVEPDAVTVAYVYSKTVTYSWHHSVIQMLGWDIEHDARVMRGGWIAWKYGTDGLVDARNKAVKVFLEEHQAEWLFWVDTDMGFASDTVDRLLEAADPVERPIVGGLAFSQREEKSDGIGGWRCRATPTVFDWLKLDDGQMGFAVRWDYPRDTLVRCAGTGSACILIHRSVFERLEAKFGPVWYDRVPNTTMGQVVSEDLSFCLRAGAMNIPVHVHTGVKTSHEKTVWLAEDDYFGEVALAKMALPVSPVQPATERVAVIVPVMRRPQNAAPFMASLLASTGLADVYAVVHREDHETRQAWKAAGAQLIVDEAVTFAEKVNLGYANTMQPWLFLVGDDVRFHPGWLDHAQAAARDGADVVGTNDLGNPRVTSGGHATHLLIRRSYVDEQGASWDGPKIVAHESYGHWFVDDEVVAVAKQRGTWVMAPGSIVEHMHPAWGKAETDDVYELGQSHAEKDRALFEERSRTFAS
jgi:hypothetical protein